MLYQIQVMLPRTLSIKIEMKTKAYVYIQFHPAQEQRQERERAAVHVSVHLCSKTHRSSRTNIHTKSATTASVDYGTEKHGLLSYSQSFPNRALL